MSAADQSYSPPRPKDVKSRKSSPPPPPPQYKPWRGLVWKDKNGTITRRR
jgi:hypothetical protein